MKKIFALLLATVLLLSALTALADGNMTENEITFSTFRFGDTFANIRNARYLRNINFQRGPYSPRNLADAVDYIADWQRRSETIPVCFSSEPEEMHSAAGHNCDTVLWFVYPVENGEPVVNEADAVFYAGEYRFWNDMEDAKTVYDDLEQKLLKLYGEPFLQGDSVDAVLGPVSLSKEFQENYQETVGRFEPTYTVWKSAANNVLIVLKYYKQDGFFDCTKLSYISPEAAEAFTRLNMDSGMAPVSDSMEGL